MTPEQLKENFTQQFNTAIEDIKNLEAQLNAKRELALKLKGALETLDLLNQGEEQQEPPNAAWTDTE